LGFLGLIAYIDIGLEKWKWSGMNGKMVPSFEIHMSEQIAAYCGGCRQVREI
jgi:hypothetical protein